MPRECHRRRCMLVRRSGSHWEAVASRFFARCSERLSLRSLRDDVRSCCEGRFRPHKVVHMATPAHRKQPQVRPRVPILICCTGRDTLARCRSSSDRIRVRRPSPWIGAGLSTDTLWKFFVYRSVHIHEVDLRYITRKSTYLPRMVDCSCLGLGWGIMRARSSPELPVPGLVSLRQGCHR